MNEEEKKRLAERMAGLITDREHDSLRLVAGGMTNAEVGAHLSISHHTVKFHMENVRRKLMTRSRAHSVAKAIKLGLLSVEDIIIDETVDEGATWNKKCTKAERGEA